MEANKPDTTTEKIELDLSSSKSSQLKRIKEVYQKLEITLVVFLIIVVWGLLSLPVIFFHLPEENISEKKSNSSVNGSICLQSSKFLQEKSECYSALEGVLVDSCPSDTANNIKIIRDKENTVRQLKQGLQVISASDDCNREVFPFLCQHLFGLCSKSGHFIPPTSTECERLKNSICQREWKTALQFGLELPNCDSLSSQEPPCSSISANQTILNDSTTDSENLSNPQREFTNTLFVCAHGFYREKGSSVCVPDCHTWIQYELTLSITIDVVVCIAATAGFLAAIVVIVISYIRRSRMLAFPSMFIVYMVLDMWILAFAVLINYMDRPGLFCSSRNLIESVQKVTPFCVISGMLFTYLLSQVSLWWLFHTSSFFWKVLFPFHSRSFEVSGRIKHIHISCVVIGIVLPFIPIITSMSKFAADVHSQANNESSPGELFLSGGLGFASARFPAILCVASNKNVVFYSFVLPMDLILAIGCTLLLIIFWTVHKQSNSIKANDNAGIFKFGAAEKKLIVVLCYCIILSTISLTAFTLTTRNASTFMKNIGHYFLCEQGGHDPDNPCMDDYNQQSYPFLNTLPYVLLGLFPVVNLIYIINLKELKEFMEKVNFLKKKKKKPYYSSDTPSTGSTVAMVSTLKRK